MLIFICVVLVFINNNLTRVVLCTRVYYGKKSLKTTNR